jgi:hypothetical protein
VVRAVAWLGTTQPSFEIAAETFSRLVGVWMSSTTLWRCHGEVAGQIEQQLSAEEEGLTEWAREAEEEKQRVAAQSAVRERASVSVDGALIRIREEGYREVKMVSVSEVGERSEPGEKRDEAGEYEDALKLQRHSYRAVLGDKGTFEPGLRAELVRRRVMDAAEITSVNDGAEWIWDLVGRYLPEKRVEVLDWSHAIQNLAKAAAAGWGEGTAEAQAWLAERKAELWAGRVDAVGVALLRQRRKRGERGRVIRNVQEYVTQHARRMDYARFRAEGRPIGSGTVESGAKNVVQWRMKRGGQSWSPSGARRMLAALGELHSERWESACRTMGKAA